ncbi:type II toxin-antitoxin system RelE/ParE family toxin [Planktothrix paucivesiculata]|nr:type II toxin-antitoxin system RelE/ParE family toxin [Planktothrix paucivesiculata]
MIHNPYINSSKKCSINREFQVKLTQNAKLEIESAYLWLKNLNPNYADQWFRDLMNTIATLQDQPKRFALARENDDFPEEIRQIIYGKSRNKYRIIFTIREDIVYILYLRHSAQSSITFNPLDLE